MAPTKPPTNAPAPSPNSPHPHKKLPRLPKNTRIHKRPLLHPPIPSPYTSSSSPKIIYISPHTPIISALKRARKLLTEIDKRAGVGAGVVLSSSSSSSNNKKNRGAAGTGNDKVRQLEAQIEAAATVRERRKKDGKEEEVVVLKGAGRAVERCCQIGVKLMGEGDLRVRVRTGSVGAVDDLVVDEDVGGDEGGVGEEDEEGEEVVEEVPEARLRQVSFVEVVVGLR